MAIGHWAANYGAFKARLVAPSIGFKWHGDADYHHDYDLNDNHKHALVQIMRLFAKPINKSLPLVEGGLKIVAWRLLGQMFGHFGIDGKYLLNSGEMVEEEWSE